MARGYIQDGEVVVTLAHVSEGHAHNFMSRHGEPYYEAHKNPPVPHDPECAVPTISGLRISQGRVGFAAVREPRRNCYSSEEVWHADPDVSGAWWDRVFDNKVIVDGEE